MATQAEYTAVANALVPELKADIDSELTKAGYGWAAGMIPAELVPEIAGACAKKAVDTLDALLAKEGGTVS